MAKRNNTALPDAPHQKLSRMLIKLFAVLVLWLSLLGVCVFVYDHFSKFVK
jgi:hypothetical protein